MSLFEQIKKSIKGSYGELKVDLVLGRLTNESSFTVRNLLLVKDGKSSQIDNILFTTKKVYVIESKNYSGWIYGSETRKSWTQTFNFYGKITRSSFYNPLIQNYGHILYLSKFLNIPLTNFVNIVVFSDNSELKNLQLERTYKYVINLKELSKLIDSIEKQSNDIFDWEDLEKLNNALQSLNKSNIFNNKKHIKFVKDTKKK